MSGEQSGTDVADRVADVSPKPRRGSAALRRVGSWRIGGVKVAPLLVLYVAFFVIPQIYFFRLAFYRPALFGEVTGPPGFGTFADVLGSEFYLSAIWQTIVLCSLVTIFVLPLAYPIAYLIVRFRRVGGFLFMATAATMFSSTVAMILGWRVLLARNGPINDVLIGSGLIDEPLDISNNFTAVVIGTVHAVLPIVIIGLMPVMQQVPPTQVMAARSLGASEWSIFSRIFLPQTITGCVAVGMLAFATTAGAFTTPVLLGGGRVGVLSILMYSDATTALNYPRAAVLAVILFVIVLLTVAISLGYSRFRIGRRGTSS
ncbi:ABC transporter permease [Blastococcus sp. CT_GayMR20]|uniref:ABC transporter permease n=1 Tax=Blastococcus sp. CT_GayMR20 TaxID=2559609 RepID=UPI0010748787|nr:ABC transporter permease [Blastococcus sp. CT_GayMR20]TFV88950.1 ABC transporter permease [Blastococcus sp. CT_GayMR20]